ncbi:MAG: winged helix-turn-helix domain-containing protein [Candidatus Sericytochromatia bacterium]
MYSLKLSEARALSLNSQHLHQRGHGLAQASQMINHLGYVQIDAISVIERAHHHVLWSRIGDYQPSWLNTLLEQREVFEYWGHAASYLPFADFRYYLPQMQNFAERSRWARERLATYGHLLPEVLQRLEQEGPLSTRHFQATTQRPSGGWWNWKPAKIALELLYWQGQVMVSRREGFDKVYDLAERVIPAGLDRRLPNQAETARFCVRRALQSLGCAQPAEIAKHLPLSHPSHLKVALEELCEEGEVSLIQVAGQTAPEYALTASLKGSFARSNEARLLSPFDNLVIQRKRFQRLFGGDYLFEAYVPAAKRQYGYFSLPLLLKDELIGYLDCKALRKEQHLAIQQATWLRTLKKHEETRVQTELKRFATLNACHSITGWPPL